MRRPDRLPRIMEGAPPAPEAQATLANWRTAPFSRWAFHHVREIVPGAEIRPGAARELSQDRRDLSRLPLPDGAGGETTLERLLVGSASTGLVALRGGRIAFEWYDGYDGLRPHLLFSVSKSMTGLLAGLLVDDGRLDPAQRIGALLPEVAGSAYADASLEHVLDMTVSTSFDESYLDPAGDYQRYRVATNWNPAPPGAESADLRSFLGTLRPADAPHGAAMHYVSPNTDLLGWVIERATGRRFADLFAERIWAPMGAEAPAEITVDRLGAPRTAGGISARPRDLARLGETVRLRGLAGGRPVIPGWWIDDMWAGGDRAAWRAGDMRELFPAGRYRSQWYQTGLPSGALAAVGIHGQWLWIDPEREVVIAKAAAQPEPVDDALDQRIIAALDALAGALARPVA